MKKCFSIILACLLVFSICPVQVIAQDQQVMTAEAFVNCLKRALARQAIYSNSYPYNLGYYDGTNISWDCWNLGKSIIWSGGSIVDNTTVGTFQNVDESCGLRDWDGLTIINKCPNKSSDFSSLVPGEWLYLEGHVGYYIGDGQVIECTVSWGYSGVIQSQIDANGNRSFNGESGGSWLYHGMVPWIDYSNSTRGQSNEEIIYNFLRDNLGMNTAAACGVLANIERESNFDPTCSWIDTNGLESFGICQWNGSRNTAVRNYCANHGYAATSLIGQLEYLRTELLGDESYAYSMVKNVDNTIEGAYQAGYNWAQHFERCAHYYNGVDQYETRAQLAVSKYWPKYCDTSLPPFVAITETRYTLKNKATNKYLMTDGGSKDEYTNVSVAAYSNQDTFHWDCVYDSLGCKLSPQNCSYLLNPYSNTPGIGTNINLFRLVGGDATQRWQFTKVGNGYIIHMASNPYLTVGVENGSNVALKSYDPSDDTQIWYLECLSHNWNSGTVTSSATCTENGVRTYTCSLCGSTRTESISALGHSWGGWTYLNETQHQRVCNRDSSHKETANHTWNSGVITKAATCTESGIKQYTCTTCNATKTETIVALGHDYRVTEILSGTCLTPEQVKYTCSRCGDVKTETPTEEWTEWSTTQPPIGDNYIIESKTQYRYSDYETKSSYKTSESGWISNGSSWVEDGTGYLDYVPSWPSGFDKTHQLYNTYKTTPNDEITETTKRTFSSPSTVGYIYWHWCRGDNAGINDGNWNRYYNYVGGYDAEGGINYSTFHAFLSTSPLSLTSTSDGSRHYWAVRDDICGSTAWWAGSLMTNTTSEHNLMVMRSNYTDYKMLFNYYRWTDYSEWQDTAVTASDTRQVETRTVYRYKLKDQVPVAHVWDEGTVTTEPTCINEGVRTLTCTLCGTTTTEAIPALGHQEQPVSGTPATCTVNGLTDGVVCARCNAVLTAQTEIPALGHEEHFVPGTPATCTQAGLTDGAVCNRCNEVLTAQEEIPALGHLFGDWTAITEATCTASGEEKHVCARCGIEETRVVDPLSHNPGEAVKVNEIEATCTTGGGYDMVIYCTRCGNIISSNHSDTEPLGHSFGPWVTTKPATETEEGIETRTCTRSNCGATETRPIPKPEPTDADLDIEIDSVMTQAGKTVTIDVYVTKAAPVTYLCLTPSYDKNVLTLSEINNGDLFDTLEKGSSLLFSSDTDVTTTGKLVTLTFIVAENADEGEYPIRLNIREAYDYDEDIVTVSVKPGAITVQNFIYGDVTGDGIVDGRDLVRLRKYLANLNEETGESTAEIFAGADCTGDGVVDGRDLIRLRKYLANLDEETGESPIHLGP